MVELSHVVTAGMVTYPGLPGPEITQHLTRKASRAHYPPGTEFEIGRISMVGNTGTYLDSPYHRYPEGADLAGIGVGGLAALDVTGCAVLLHTGWDRFFGTPAYSDPAPYLTAEGARWLVDHGARLVGIDSINIDDPVEGGERPAHSTLLAVGIPVVEHLSGLEQLPPTGARFTAVPPPIVGFTTFPVRAFAVVPR